MQIIDAHAHIFPSKIASRAVGSIGAFYDLQMHAGGTAEALLKSGAEIGVSRYLVCSVATRADQVEAINRFLMEEMRLHPEFVPFAAVHPAMERVEETIEEAVQAGFYGLKLHPDFQEFAIDDPCADAIYRAAEGKLPILFHTGDRRYSYSDPKRLVRVMEKYPDLVCIGAHFGGWSCWDEVEQVYRGCKNIYFDTSSSLPFVKPEQAAEMIDRMGSDRFFFGTDFPMWTHAAELNRFMKIGLSESVKEQILFRNFSRVVLHET